MTAGQRSGRTILFVGPMLGTHPGKIASPAEAVAERLEREGVRTSLTSAKLNPLARGIDIFRSISHHDEGIDTAVVLVYSGRSFHYADLASRICRRQGTRVVFWLHGGGLPELAKRVPGRLQRVLDRGADHVVPSAFLRRAMEGTIPRARVIPNLLDVETYPFRSRGRLEPRMLWMRSFVSHCRPDLAVRTLASVSRTRPEATLTMAGPDQGELEPTRRLADELGVIDQIRFIGFVSGENKRQELERHDIYLHTNVIDNAPISLLEAGASGLPIAGCAVGGVADLMPPDRASLLAATAEPDELAGLVVRLVDDPVLATDLAGEARRIAEASAWTRLRASWLSILGRSTGV